MSGIPETEKQQAGREARNAVASRPAGSAATEAALRRYLGAEAYHELRQENQETEDRKGSE